MCIKKAGGRNAGEQPSPDHPTYMSVHKLEATNGCRQENLHDPVGLLELGSLEPDSRSSTSAHAYSMHSYFDFHPSSNASIKRHMA
jgi:hypothetical protein